MSQNKVPEKIQKCYVVLLDQYGTPAHLMLLEAHPKRKCQTICSTTVGQGTRVACRAADGLSVTCPECAQQLALHQSGLKMNKASYAEVWTETL